MHLFTIAVAFILALGLRCLDLPAEDTWPDRWGRSLFLFLFPPILLLMTALSVIIMGAEGQMFGMDSSWPSYIFCLLFIVISIGILCKLGYQGYLSHQEISKYSQELVAGKKARILETDFPYSAQIGFWNSQLVISRGMLNTLDSEHLAAVIAHEQAHYYHRDTFYFFWLGWLRSFSFWLPNTEALWQELLLLREIRADARAAEKVDSLLLAESLLKIAKEVLLSVKPNLFKFPESNCSAGLSCTLPRDRLTERIDALLCTTAPLVRSNYWFLGWIILAFLPLITVPFHY